MMDKNITEYKRREVLLNAIALRLNALPTQRVDFEGDGLPLSVGGAEDLIRGVYLDESGEIRLAALFNLYYDSDIDNIEEVRKLMEEVALVT